MRSVLIALAAVLLLPACTQEPLAPAFAGRWEPADAARAPVGGASASCGPATIAIGRDGISVRGGRFPLGATVLAIEKMEVRGATADLVLRPRDPTHGLAAMAAGREIEVPRVDIHLTLRAQSDRVYASNVLFRNQATGLITTAPRVANRMMRDLTLRRCV